MGLLGSSRGTATRGRWTLPGSRRASSAAGSRWRAPAGGGTRTRTCLSATSTESLPIGEPLRVVLLVGGLDGLERGVGWGLAVRGGLPG